MNDEKSDHIMDDRAAREEDARLSRDAVASQHDPVRDHPEPASGRSFPRVLVWIAVVVGLLGLAILLRVLIPSSLEQEGRYLELIERRFPDSVKFDGPTLRKKKGEKRTEPAVATGDSTSILAELFIHRHRKGALTIVGTHLLGSGTDRFQLAADEVFRLGVRPARPGHVLIFRASGRSTVEQLLPNADYLSAKNPVQSGWPFYVPSPNEWFSVTGRPGEERFFVIASSVPQTELVELYGSYIKALRDEDREKEADRLRAHVESMHRAQPKDVQIVAFSVCGS